MEEHLGRGTIGESKSPYAANFFFVKKKDNKLQPVQDYRPLNKWTQKNRNVSPLIPQVIHIIQHNMYDVLMKTHVQNSRRHQESPHGPMFKLCRRLGMGQL